jgi:hypothetical protein
MLNEVLEFRPVSNLLLSSPANIFVHMNREFKCTVNETHCDEFNPYYLFIGYLEKWSAVAY